MACPHAFATLGVDQEVFAAIDWSTEAQQLYCRVITSQGHYGLLRRGSPDRARILLTPHGVLQVCLLHTLPFATRCDTRIRTLRDARHTRQCTDRPELVARLAEALLEYDQARAEMQQTLVQKKTQALHPLLAVREIVGQPLM